MTLVVGLGNPGEKYKSNRHNAGFIVVNELALSWGLVWTVNKKINAEVATAFKGADGETILIKPLTFMNDSGEAVAKALKYFGGQLVNLLVVHDDVDLGDLQFKTARNSSSAGHHGVQSIIDHLGTQDFTRIRVGIGRPVVKVDGAEQAVYAVEEYVLQDFSPEQLELVKKQGIEHLLSSLNL